MKKSILILIMGACILNCNEFECTYDIYQGGVVIDQKTNIQAIHCDPSRSGGGSHYKLVKTVKL